MRCETNGANAAKGIFLLLASLLCINTFSQTAEEIEAAFEHPAQKEVHPLDPILNLMSKQDFKNDFICTRPIKKTLNESSYSLLFKYKKVPYIKDKAAFSEAYSALKEEMIFYHQKDPLYYANEIQHLSLQILRYHFLLDQSSESVEETKFLLGILIESGAVDLDVLADAYIKVEHALTNTQQTGYRNYIKNQYFIDKKYIANHFEEYKNLYEMATGTKKQEYFYNGKHLVRKSQALRYVNDLLNIESGQKN